MYLLLLHLFLPAAASTTTASTTFSTASTTRTAAVNQCIRKSSVAHDRYFLSSGQSTLRLNDRYSCWVLNLVSLETCFASPVSIQNVLYFLISLLIHFLKQQTASVQHATNLQLSDQLTHGLEVDTFQVNSLCIFSFMSGHENLMYQSLPLIENFYTSAYELVFCNINV